MVDYRISRNKIEEAIKQLEDIDNKYSDTEQAHIDADAVLMDLLPDDLVKAYEKISKWYA